LEDDDKFYLLEMLKDSVWYLLSRHISVLY